MWVCQVFWKYRGKFYSSHGYSFSSAKYLKNNMTQFFGCNSKELNVLSIKNHEQGMIVHSGVINIRATESVDSVIFVSLSDIIDWIYSTFGMC